MVDLLRMKKCACEVRRKSKERNFTFYFFVSASASDCSSSVHSRLGKKKHQKWEKIEDKHILKKVISFSDLKKNLFVFVLSDDVDLIEMTET